MTIGKKRIRLPAVPEHDDTARIIGIPLMFRARPLPGIGDIKKLGRRFQSVFLPSSGFRKNDIAPPDQECVGIAGPYSVGLSWRKWLFFRFFRKFRKIVILSTWQTADLLLFSHSSTIFLFSRKILSTSKWRIFRVSKGGAFSLLEKFSGRNWNFILPQKRV